MVLVVKLKNPNRRVVEADGAQLSDSSLEYRSAAEPEGSVSPQAVYHDSNDGALDELSAALQKTQLDAIAGGHEEETNVTAETLKKEEEEPLLPAQASTSAARPAVDVLIAPAVIGHRWVRTRANSFVVERPERIRAVSLGVAAVLAKEQDERERGNVDVQSIAARLDTLSVGGGHQASSREQQQQASPLAVHLSNCRLSLSRPTPALEMIHALEEEYLTVDSVVEGDTPSAAAQDLPKVTLSYAAYLDELCAKAASDVPAPLAPRSVRQGISPKKAHDEADDEPPQHRSEVPSHLPQGDLYLCGSRAAIKMEATTSADQKLDALVDDLPRTPKVEENEENRGLLQNPYKDEEAWRKEGSKGAIEAALGTGCAAVDRVVAASLAIRPADRTACSSIDTSQLQEEGGVGRASSQVDREPALRSFVIVRPPGHHCNATQPSGFCWVNNAAVMAAHAFHEHGIDRIAILDFDLHHGNGTQSIAWRINADTVRHDLEREAKLKAMRADLDRKMKRTPRKSDVIPSEHPTTVPLVDKRGLKMFYGSLHDIESFPCEDGNKELITDASMCIEGAHGQWIWNVHLDAHTDVADAQRLYENKYYQLIEKARSFFASTDASPEKSLILISAGFDACIHEQAGMQRHGKSVPPQFYETFTRDVVALADERCGGKCISILEGGYSDRALTSATIAHLIGLSSSTLGGTLYQPSSLYQLEKIAKTASSLPPRRKQDALTRDGVWLDYTLEAFRRLEDILGRRRAEGSNRTNPSTPTRAMLDQLWKSPRETRSHRGPLG